MGLDNLHADIAARYDRLNQSLAKGMLKPEVASVLSHRYAYPVAKDALGMANLGSAQINRIADNCVPFVISTQEVDSDGDIVVSLGGDYGRYRLNPFIYFGHGSWQVPIGMARKSIDGPLEVFPEERLIRANAYFDMPDPDAAFIYGKVQRGILNATSISFIPKLAYQRERIKSQHEDQSPMGWVFERWELTEFSIVALPANAGAIRDSYDSEKSFMSPRLQKAWMPYCAQAKGKCFTGYCPCPPCEEDMSKSLNAATLVSGLPGKKKSKICGCKGKCSRCKSLPGENTGAGAAGDREHEHAHEQEHADKSELQTAVAAKMPKLMECGYSEAESGAIAHHLCAKGAMGEEIDGHEEVARMLGYKKDEGDMGEESMSLKSFVKSIKKEADEEEKPEEKPEESAESTEESEEEDEPAQFKESAKMLGHMHNHMKNAHDYLSKALPMMDHEHIAKAMTAHCKDLEGHCENYKELAGKYHPDLDFEKMCKGLGEGGEAEEVSDETGTGGEEEATTATEERDDDASGKSGTELIREDYQKPKGAKRQTTKAKDELDSPEVKQYLDKIAGSQDRISETWFTITGQRV